MSQISVPNKKGGGNERDEGVTGWWFHFLLIFTPGIGEMIKFDIWNLLDGLVKNHQTIKIPEVNEPPGPWVKVGDHQGPW